MQKFNKKSSFPSNNEQSDSVPTASGVTGNSRPPKAIVEGNVKLLETFSLPKDFMSCRFNPDGNLLAVALSNGVIKVFSTESKSCVYSIPNENSKLPVTCFRWKSHVADQKYKNILIATYASGEVKQWHVPSGKCLWSVNEDRQVLTCAASTNGSRLITSGSDAKILLYDASTKELINTFESSTKSQCMDGHTMRVFVVQFHPNDDNVFVSGGWDDSIQWWDARQDSSHNIRKIIGPHICGEGLDIEPESLNIVTGSWRKSETIQVWDFNSGNLIANVPADSNRSMMYSVQWMDKNTIVAGGSHCNMVQFINVKSLLTTGRLMDLPGAVYSIDNNRKGSQPIVAAGCAENVYLMQGI